MLVWGTLTASVAQSARGAGREPGVLPVCGWTGSVGTHFFDVANGGRPLLWQHLFWMFAHPWVYAVVLPAMGIVSDALPVFCRRPLVGYAAGRAVDGRDDADRLRRVDPSYVRDRPARRSRCRSSARPAC